MKLDGLKASHSSTFHIKLLVLLKLIKDILDMIQAPGYKSSF